MILLKITLFTLILLNIASNCASRCVTTRHVSGYGNRGGGFITNDLSSDFLYFNNERCSWEVAVPNGATITFNLIENEMEQTTRNGDCFDWIAIYDGPDRFSPLLYKGCQIITNQQTIFQTTQNYGFVLFFSDDSRRSEGFRIRWSRMGKLATFFYKDLFRNNRFNFQMQLQNHRQQICLLVNDQPMVRPVQSSVKLINFFLSFANQPLVKIPVSYLVWEPMRLEVI